MTHVLNPEWRLRDGFTPPVAWDNAYLHLATLSGQPFIPRLPHLGLNHVGSHRPKLKLADYIDAATAQPPPAVARPHAGFSWGMLANDHLGDCVCAAILHAINSWLLDIGGNGIPFTDADAIALYEAIGKYNPADPSTDQGCDEATAMQIWQAGLPQTSDGLVHKLAGTVAVDASNLVEVRIAIDEFDGIFDGIDLPVSAQGQAEWDVVGDPQRDSNSQPGSWGGHATYTREYDPVSFKLLTWGAELLETVAFRTTYHSQAFALIPQDAQQIGHGPSNVAWGDLLSDLNKLVPVQAEEPATQSRPSPPPAPKPAAAKPKPEPAPEPEPETEEEEVSDE